MSLCWESPALPRHRHGLCLPDSARESLNLGYLQRGKVHFINTGGVSVELMVPLSPQLCSGAALPVLLQPRAVCPLTPCACGTATSVRPCLFVCSFSCWKL